MITPCVQICRINPKTRLCEGCGRTLSEIQNWLKMPATDREFVMSQLEERRSGEKSLTPKN